MQSIRSRHVFVNFIEAAAEPPQNAPAKQQYRSGIFDFAHTRALAPEIPGAKQARDANKNAANINTIESRPDGARCGGANEASDTGGKLQEDTESAGSHLTLAHADPYNRRAFHGPCSGGPAAIERERNRQRAENDAQSEKRF